MNLHFSASTELGFTSLNYFLEELLVFFSLYQGPTGYRYALLFLNTLHTEETPLPGSPETRRQSASRFASTYASTLTSEASFRTTSFGCLLTCIESALQS